MLFLSNQMEELQLIARNFKTGEMYTQRLSSSHAGNTERFFPSIFIFLEFNAKECPNAPQKSQKFDITMSKTD